MLPKPLGIRLLLGGLTFWALVDAILTARDWAHNGASLGLVTGGFLMSFAYSMVFVAIIVMLVNWGWKRLTRQKTARPDKPWGPASP